MIIFITREASNSSYATSIVVESSSTNLFTLTIVVVILIGVFRRLILVNNFSLVKCMIIFLILRIEHIISCIMWSFFTYGAPFFLWILQIIRAILCLLWCYFLTYFTIVFFSNHSNFLPLVISALTSNFFMSFHNADCTLEVCIS